MPQLASKTASLMIRLTPEDKIRVQEFADKHGLSMSAAVVFVLRAYLQGPPPAPTPAAPQEPTS